MTNFILQNLGKMDSTRQHKYAKLILRDLADIFQHDYMNSFSPALVTLTGVEVSPDLGIATVYVSVLPSKEKERVIESIEHKKNHIRGELGKRIGKQARIVPDLRFFLDETEEKAAHMDDLFKDLDIPPEEENTHNQE